MANRRYDEGQYDQRSRSNYDRDEGRQDYRSSRQSGYEHPRIREDYAEDRFRAGSQWDRNRRDEERAPGRAYDTYGRGDNDRQDEGSAYGFARHERHYDDDYRDRGGYGHYRQSGQGDYRESGGSPYSADQQNRGYQSGSSSVFQDQQGGRSGAQGFRGHGPKDYKRSDERIREDVCDRLADADNVDARGISVEVSDGEVTLKGHVSSRQTKRAAEDAVENCSGVRHLQNNLRVRDSDDDSSSDNSAQSSTDSSKTRAKSN